MKPGETWLLGDDSGGETIATILEIWDAETVLVLVLSSTLQGCRPGTTEPFSASWFESDGSLLSPDTVRS